MQFTNRILFWKIMMMFWINKDYIKKKCLLLRYRSSPPKSFILIIKESLRSIFTLDFGTLFFCNGNVISITYEDHDFYFRYNHNLSNRMTRALNIVFYFYLRENEKLGGIGSRARYNLSSVMRVTLMVINYGQMIVSSKAPPKIDAARVGRRG